MFDTLFSGDSCADTLAGLLLERRRVCPALRAIPVGKSSCGRKIQAVAIGNLKHPVLFAGGLSADDRISVLLLLRFLWDITDGEDLSGIKASSNLPKFFHHGGIILLPMANPDGFEIAAHGVETAGYLRRLAGNIRLRSREPWRASATGVDLTRNFDADFDLEAAQKERPSPTGCAGSRPESEAETKALARLCAAFHLKRVVEFRSPGEDVAAAIGKNAPSSAGISSGLIANSCGYRLLEPEQSREPGSLKDWFSQKSGLEGYTIKAGRSSPVPKEDLEPLYARLVQTMLLCMIL